VLVDDEDYYDLLKTKWYATTTNYAKGRSGYMHSFLKPTDDPTKVVDHINGNGFDNRKSNLRIVSRSINARCKRKRQDSASTFQGVWKTTSGKRWQANITIKGKKRYLGSFDTEEEAGQKYKEELDKLVAIDTENNES
jgi:hypothetical protein